MQEIVLVDKPKGISSFGVIARMRKKLNIRKIGHAGTLDPLATGLMILGIDKGTKRLTEFIKSDKVYEAEVLLGIKTTTGDLEGEIAERVTRNEERINFDKDYIKKVLDSLVGEVELPVSIYSAIKKNGVPLYKRARRRESVEVPMRKMKIYWIEFLGIETCVFCYFRKSGNFQSRFAIVDFRLRGNDRMDIYKNNRLYQVIKIRLKVGSGTYIRSIAEEIGNRLGIPATVKELRRTQIGEFKIEDAIII